MINYACNNVYRGVNQIIQNKTGYLVTNIACGVGITVTSAYVMGKSFAPSMLQFAKDSAPFVQGLLSSEMGTLGFLLTGKSLPHIILFGAMGVAGLAITACLLSSVIFTMTTPQQEILACRVQWALSHISMGLSLSTLFIQGATLATPAVHVLIIGCVVGLSYTLTKRIIDERADWQNVFFSIVTSIALAPIAMQVSMGIAVHEIIARACAIEFTGILGLSMSFLHTARARLEEHTTARIDKYRVDNKEIKEVKFGETVFDIPEDFINYIKGIKAVYKQNNDLPPKCILMQGDPGTGKTIVVKAVANELGTPLFALNPSCFDAEPNVTPAKKLQQIFEDLRNFVKSNDGKNIMLLLDEGDTYLSDPGATNAFKVELDGINKKINAGIIIVLTTNHPDKLDKAILSRLGEPYIAKGLNIDNTEHVKKVIYTKVKSVVENQLRTSTIVDHLKDLQDMQDAISRLTSYEITKARTKNPCTINFRNLQHMLDTMFTKAVGEMYRKNIKSEEGILRCFAQRIIAPTTL